MRLTYTGNRETKHLIIPTGKTVRITIYEVSDELRIFITIENVQEISLTCPIHNREDMELFIACLLKKLETPTDHEPLIIPEFFSTNFS